MDDTRRRPVAIALASGLEVTACNGTPVSPRSTVRLGDVTPLLWGQVLAVEGVVPLYAAELDLETGLGVTSTVPREELLKNGGEVLAEVRSAVLKSDLGRLRKLCSWFRFSLRMPEVHALLDSLPRARAEQVAGMLPGQGRRARPSEHLQLIAAIDLLRQKGLTALEAARRVAKVHRACTVETLANLHAEFGKLVRCRTGYWIPVSEIPCAPWTEAPEVRLPVYILGQ